MFVCIKDLTEGETKSLKLYDDLEATKVQIYIIHFSMHIYILYIMNFIIRLSNFHLLS